MVRLWGAILLGLVLCACWRSDAADDGMGVGLRGIWPAEVPEDLVEAVMELPESWSMWGEGLSGELMALYTQENLDVAGQRQTLAALSARVQTLRVALADRRYAPIYGTMLTLQGGLSRRIDLANAILDTLESKPTAAVSNLEQARADLVRTAEKTAGFLARVEGGQPWVEHLYVPQARTVPTGNAQQEAVVVLTAVDQRFQADLPEGDAAREFMRRPELAEYAVAVRKYLQAVVAATQGPNSPNLRTALGELVKAAADYDTYRLTQHAQNLRAAFDAVRMLSPDGGEKIGMVIRTHYLNFNLRLVVSEHFANRLITEQKKESGAVDDCILGAKVDGCQYTNTKIQMQFIPDPNMARLEVMVSGQVTSNTQGVTQMATIFTQGNHSFWMGKQVVFNGEQTSTFPAWINVCANNTTVGAQTCLHGMPLLGSIADKYAFSKAVEKKPESEAIAREKIAEKAVPRFNEEVDKSFAPGGTVNNKLETKILKPLRDTRLYPETKMWSTTADHMYGNIRLMQQGEVGGGSPYMVYPQTGVLVFVHESMLNNALDRMQFHGKTMTDDEFMEELRGNLNQILGKSVNLTTKPKEESDDAPKTFVFDQYDPIRFRIQNGALRLSIRAAFKRPGKEDIPAQVVTIPIKFEVKENVLVLDPGEVDVAAVVKPANVAEQIARAGVIRKKIGESLPHREIDRFFDIDVEGRKIPAGVTNVMAYDGWMVLTIE